MNDTAEFTVIYDGEALEENLIDVKDLAPALLSIGNIFQEANRVLNGDEIEIKIYVKATGAGSFQIDFTTVQSFTSQVKGILLGDTVTGAINLKEIIGIGSVAVGVLFWVIKKLRGRNPDKIENIGNGVYRLTVQNEIVDIPVKTLRLYQDLSVRKAAEGIVAPLKKAGINSLKVKDKSGEKEIVNKSEAEYFDVSNAVIEETILNVEREQAFSIISLSFKEDNKWRLHDGNAHINVKIIDEDFLSKVDKGIISFTKGDILVCRIKSIQKNTAEGLKNEYEVLKVLEHRKVNKQLSLF